jgi:hypothetical protein
MNTIPIWKILKFAVLYQYILQGEEKATEMYDCSAMNAMFGHSMPILTIKINNLTIIMLDYLHAIMQTYFSFNTYCQFLAF